MTTTQENMLARHQIVHELGRGALGAVYAARDRTTGAAVALKRLDPSLGRSDASLAGRFLEQARSARRLAHRNIVRIHDAGEAAGTAYVAMEMLEGRNLRSLLDAGPLPVARAIRIAHDVASGLAHAHLEGVVHGGLTPSNVIVSPSGVAKITDFGTGQVALVSEVRAGAGAYASPERLRGDPVDHRSDIFSLGVLFYEMLAGRRPLPGNPAPPSELNLLVPRALDPIVLGMLAAQPAARMPGVPVLLRELQGIEEALGLEPAASPPPVPPQPRAPMQPTADELQHRNWMIDRETFDYRRATMERESRPERSPWSRALSGALVLVLAVVGIGLIDFGRLAALVEDWSDRGERILAAPRNPTPVAPAPAPTKPADVEEGEAVKDSAAMPPLPDPLPPKPIAAEPAPLAQTASPVARPPEAPAIAPAAPAPPPPRATQPAAKVAAQQPGGTARLIVAVSPRGELYIDGEHRGTTPPVTTLELEPGMHRIEVRSGSRKPYLTYMTVEPGDVRRIRHDFNAKPIRPPG